MKRLLKTVMWLGLIIYLVVVLGLVADKEKSIPCRFLVVTMEDTVNQHFISDQDVYSYILDHDNKLLGKPLGEINTDRFEKLAASIPFVRRAEVFKTSEGSLHITISQREPVLHVLNPGGNNYYVDNEGYIMPESSFYTARTVIVNGSFLMGAKPGHKLDDPEMKNFRTLKKSWKLACYIHQNSFWKAQIEQIWVSEKGEFTLIPRLGAQTILFGDLYNYKTKFENLELLYKQRFAGEGWNKYKKINLKYSNQVICTKK